MKSVVLSGIGIVKPSKSVLAGLLFAVAVGLFSPALIAQNLSDRAGKWEASLRVHSVESENFSSESGSQAAVDGSTGWGFGIGYNFNSHWALSFDTNYREADYTATTTPAAGNSNPASRLSGDLDISVTQFNATYYFLPKALTPFISAGLGATWVNTDIPDGLPVSACWYDPWWGYYCGTSVPTKSDTFFSYNVGAGVRWDSKGPLFLRGLVMRQWMDVGGGLGTPSLDQVRIDIGFRFQ